MIEEQILSGDVVLSINLTNFRDKFLSLWNSEVGHSLGVSVVTKTLVLTKIFALKLNIATSTTAKNKKYIVHNINVGAILLYKQQFFGSMEGSWLEWKRDLHQIRGL